MGVGGGQAGGQCEDSHVRGEGSVGSIVKASSVGRAEWGGSVEWAV